MEIKQHWETICMIVNKALQNNRFCAIATLNPDGSPHVSPIGSLILDEAGKGFYFEEFPKNMRRNLDQDQRICVMAVNGGFWYWLKALFKGRFDAPCGVRLTGMAGTRRLATQEEVRRWQDRVKSVRSTKGYKLLWKDMCYVREVTFDAFEPVNLGLMGRGLWEKEQ